MRPCQELIHQIRWDPRLDASQFVIGVQTRRRGIQEKPLLQLFVDEEILWYRIVYIKGPRGVIWDREAKVENLHLLTEGPASSSVGLSLDTEKDCLRLMSWNCLSDRHAPDLGDRLPMLVESVRGTSQQLEVLALQEVGPDLVQLLQQALAAPWRWYGRGPNFLATRLPVLDFGELELSPDKFAVWVDLQWQGQWIRVATCHFTSQRQKNSQAKRDQQFERLTGFLRQVEWPWLCLGDFNNPLNQWQRWQQESARAFVVSPPLASFDPYHNTLAATQSHPRIGNVTGNGNGSGTGTGGGRAGSYDRLLADPRWNLQVTLAPSAAPQPSDHRQLSCQCRLNQPPGESFHRFALAIVPPRSVWEPIQRVRQVYDPAFERWPPHINLVFPYFAPEHWPDQDRLAGMQPFKIRLGQTGQFQHRQGCTTYLAPDAQSLESLVLLYHLLTGERPKDGWTPHLTMAKGPAPVPWTGPALEFVVEAVYGLQQQQSYQVERVWWLDGMARDCERRFQLAAQLGSESLFSVGSVDPLTGQPLEEGSDWDVAVLDRTVAEILQELPQGRCVGQTVRLDGVDVLTGMAAKEAMADFRAFWDVAARQFRLNQLRTLLVEVKQWARRRQIYGQAVGYPGGLAWSVLTLAALLQGADPSLHSLLQWCQSWAKEGAGRAISVGGCEGGYHGTGPAILSPGPAHSNLLRHLTRSTRRVLMDELQGVDTLSPGYSGPAELWVIGDNREGVCNQSALGLLVDLERASLEEIRPLMPSQEGTCWRWGLRLGAVADLRVQQILRIAQARFSEAQWLEG